MAEIDLFPLPLVLFPGGRLSLQVFETRYLDMIKGCLKEDKAFGIILIEQGPQVLLDAAQASPLVAKYGTSCRIVDFDQKPNGLLQIIVEGEQKFLVTHSSEDTNRLLHGEIEFMQKEQVSLLPQNKRHLAELLLTLVQHESIKALNMDINFELAFDVGARLTELLPCSNSFKQAIFEMQDPIARLFQLEKQLLRMQD